MSRATLQTKRLLLRPLRLGDTDALAALWAQDEFSSGFGLVPDTTTPESQRQEALEWIQSANAHWDDEGWGAWAVCLRDPPDEKSRFAGFCGFFAPDVPLVGPEITYGIAPALWNQGIATEAVRAALYFMFTQTEVQRVETVTHDQLNRGSARVLQKAGFEYIGLTDYQDSVEAGIGLLAHYALDRDTWRKQHPKAVQGTTR